MRISNGSEAEGVVCPVLMWCTADWTIPVAVPHYLRGTNSASGSQSTRAGHVDLARVGFGGLVAGLLG